MNAVTKAIAAANAAIAVESGNRVAMVMKVAEGEGTKEEVLASVVHLNNTITDMKLVKEMFAKFLEHKEADTFSFDVWYEGFKHCNLESSFKLDRNSEPYAAFFHQLVNGDRADLLEYFTNDVLPVIGMLPTIIDNLTMTSSVLEELKVVVAAKRRAVM
ncbi:hypothetical protein PHABIO_462 [Pseudomonas phage Phabio]|uniref:Uncharacterized protein n=1 Tax=Pseudomonas phage Phabio TaxID=2006668 RepID=A0A1Y0SUQ2_9CAUD|nr:hypothetical protein MZD05_gp457 [Pseudomonas phage Phabio]ARV77090.1 hypothetical protein PHABIO_462 [Pseudomonas phage Phabio]